MNSEYRNSAKQALERANESLNSRKDSQLRYAALELRMVLECLVYERALNYTEELSEKKLNTWQPKKLIEILLTIDPSIDKEVTLNYGRQEIQNMPAKEMRQLGVDQRLSLKDIKMYYDRLGSYLHMPTLEQSTQGKGVPNEAFRKSCLNLYEIVEKVLNSRIWNIDFKTTSSTDCYQCGGKIVRRLRESDNNIQAECIKCSASYNLIRTNDDLFEWHPNRQKIACANETCECETYIWDNDIKLGSFWICKSCGGKNAFVIGLDFIPK